MLTRTAERVSRNTPQSVQDRIRSETEASLARILAAGPAAIDARLRELDLEWDTERTLETLASSFSLAGIALATTIDRRWLVLSGVVCGFLLQHALQGWCPPLPVIRALGVRTKEEIEAERYALKVARGDFGEAVKDPPMAHDPWQLLAATKLS